VTWISIINRGRGGREGKRQRGKQDGGPASKSWEEMRYRGGGKKKGE